MHLQRQRYILFEFLSLSNKDITEKEIMRVLWSKLVRLFGEYNAYKAGLWMTQFNQNEKWGIIRCNNVTKEKVIASIAFINDINNAPLIIHTIKTSGTIKKILKVQNEFFLKHRIDRMKKI